MQGILIAEETATLTTSLGRGALRALLLLLMACACAPQAAQAVSRRAPHSVQKLECGPFAD